VLLIEGEVARAAEASTKEQTTSGTTASAQTQTQPAQQAQPGGIETVGGHEDRYVTKADAMGGTPGPIALGTEADLFCYGYIGDPNEAGPNHVAGYEDYQAYYEKGAIRQELSAAEGELVLLEGGTATGLTPGETYLVVEGGEIVYHPIDKSVIGREYTFRGQIKVLCADDHHARGLITQSCLDIHVGARLKPMPTLPIPLAKVPDIPGFCDPSSGKRAGLIVTAQGGWDEALGEGILVQINLGRDDAI